jgi:RNA polymerase sigma factor (sigma-70 family)
MVYNLALQYVQNQEDAQEIAQDVFVSINFSMRDFQGKSNISTWIYRITINKALDFLKAKRRRKRFASLITLFFPDSNEPMYEVADFDHPGTLLENKEATEAIFKHINQLPDNQKTALILTKIEGKSQTEAAEIMEISVKAVESLLQRAKSNLSKKI